MKGFKEINWNGWIPVEEKLPNGGPDADDVLVLLRRFNGETFYYSVFHGYYDAGSEDIPAKWLTNMHNRCHVVGEDVYPNGEVFETDDVVIAWMPEPELPEGLPEYKEEIEGMTYERQKELLDRLVEHELVARTSNETIKHLLYLGFYEGELIHEFGFSKADVEAASGEMDDQVD